MKDNLVIDDDLAQVLDLLGKVKSLNKMIKMHREQSGDQLMVSQYEDMKSRFLIELKKILSSFEIEVLIKDQAA